MIALIIDTETTGLYKTQERDGVYRDRVVQVAYLIVEIDLKSGLKTTLFECNQLVKQQISPHEKFCHGITADDLTRFGVSPYAMLTQLDKMMSSFKVDTIVGHNVDFDLRALTNELFYIRKSPQRFLNNLDKTWMSLQGYHYKTYCTMSLLTPVMQLPHNGEAKYSSRYKFPNLREAYEYTCSDKLTEQAATYLHNAYYDASITLLVFAELVRRGLVS